MKAVGTGCYHVANMKRQWAEWRKTGAAYLADEQQDRLRARMGDVSAFVKTLKQRYSMSYNARHGRTGTLWEERFKSVLVENGESAKAVVAVPREIVHGRNGVRQPGVREPGFRGEPPVFRAETQRRGETDAGRRLGRTAGGAGAEGGCGDFPAYDMTSPISNIMRPYPNARAWKKSKIDRSRSILAIPLKG